MNNTFLKKIQELINKGNLSGSIIAIVSFLAVITFSLTEAYEIFESTLYDLRFRIKPSVHESDSLYFVNVDESSINNVGQYPWPRHIYAAGLDILKEVGTRHTAFDFEFSDRSHKRINTDILIELNDKIDKKEKIRKRDLSELIQDNDKILAGSIELLGKVILPFHFKEDLTGEIEADDDYAKQVEDVRMSFMERASVPVSEDSLDYYKGLIDAKKIGIAMPIPELIKSAHGFGFTDRDPDIDGVERKIRLVKLFQGRIYFQMGLVMLMDMCGVKKEDVLIEPGTRIVLKGAINPVTLLQKDIVIPIDENGKIYINWAGPGPLEKSFHHISFYALLEYPMIKEDIHDFFDEEEFRSGNRERSRLYGELEKQYSKYSSNDLSVKREAWLGIKEIRKRIEEIEKGYAVPIKNEFDAIEKTLESEDNAELRERLYDLKNYLKAIDLVIDVESLQDKTAIIGMTATGTQDLGVIPISNKYMMVGTYHNVVNTILQDAFINKTSKTVDYIIMLVLAILSGVFIQRLNARMSLVVIIASLIVIIMINIGLFVYLNIVLDLIGVSLSFLIPAAAITGIKFMKEESQKRFIKHAFSHYLSPRVIDQIIDEPDLLQLGGESRNLTIFFSDVAKFSSISEALSPADLVQLLNEYLSEMTDIILDYDGTVDKYEGDAIMAFYGAPQYLEDHTVRACFAAIDMQKKLDDMRAVWRKNGRHELFVRMGLNTGDVVVGNMGSRTRMDYTVMGDSVNLASRLEGANKYYDTYTMISESTYEKAKDFVEVRHLDVIKVVGKDEPIQVYELLGRKGELSDQFIEMLVQYNEAMECFRKRDWKKARSIFRTILKSVKDDGPSRTYYERCYEYMVNPPPKNWNGVYTLKSK